MKDDKNTVLVDPLYEPFDMSVDWGLCNEVSDVYMTILSTFELRKAAWQMQSGLLFEAYPGCTHTRRAHAIGCWILGWHSLQDIKVISPKTKRGNTISLGEWIEKDGKKNNLTKEYLFSLLLHDVGHGPFSHALEANPFLKINHEDIGRSLICNIETGKINYYRLLKYLLTVYKIKGDPKKPDDYKNLYNNAKTETRVVHDVLKNGGNIDVNIMGTILDGKTKNPKLYSLHQLVDSEIDIDRIDHFLRDSYYSGIKFADYRVKGLFQNLIIVPQNTKEYNNIKNDKTKEKNSEDPPSYLIIKKEGLEQVEYLLSAREFMFERVLWHPKNLKLIGALNMGVRLLTLYEPCINSILPFITDQILLQMFRERRFVNTTIEGYEKIIRGEIPVESFQLGKEFHVNPKKLEKIKELFNIIEDFNSKSPTQPKVIIFSNIKRLKEEGEKSKNGENNWWRNVISEKTKMPLGMGEDKDLFTWLQKKENNRKNKIIIWHTKAVNLEEDVGVYDNFFEERST